MGAALTEDRPTRDTERTLVPNRRSASSQDASRLVEDHLDLVNHVVFQVAVHFPRHVDRDELARAGALGLVEAAQRYELFADEAWSAPVKVELKLVAREARLLDEFRIFTVVRQGLDQGACIRVTPALANHPDDCERLARALQVLVPVPGRAAS